MISEILLVLGGHRSSLFLANSQIHPAFSSDLHPGEKQCLEYLAHIGSQYHAIRAQCRTLLSSSKSPYICAACATLGHILQEYEMTVVDTERRILSKDVELVSVGAFVPLSSLRAVFAEWDAPMTAMLHLVEDLKTHESFQDQEPSSSRPGPLLDLLMARRATGVNKISEIMSQISISVQRIWKTHLISYLHGHASSETSFACQDHTLRQSTVPACISEVSRESIRYIGRAVGAVKAARSKHQLPRTMELDHCLLLENVLPEDQHAFDHAITEIRSQVSNYLWLTVLTREHVVEAVDSLYVDPPSP